MVDGAKQAASPAEISRNRSKSLRLPSARWLRRSRVPDLLRRSVISNRSCSVPKQGSIPQVQRGLRRLRILTCSVTYLPRLSGSARPNRSLCAGQPGLRRVSAAPQRNSARESAYLGELCQQAGAMTISCVLIEFRLIEPSARSCVYRGRCGIARICQVLARFGVEPGTCDCSARWSGKRYPATGRSAFTALHTLSGNTKAGPPATWVALLAPHAPSAYRSCARTLALRWRPPANARRAEPPR